MVRGGHLLLMGALAGCDADTEEISSVPEGHEITVEAPEEGALEMVTRQMRGELGSIVIYIGTVGLSVGIGYVGGYRRRRRRLSEARDRVFPNQLQVSMHTFQGGKLHIERPDRQVIADIFDRDSFLTTALQGAVEAKLEEVEPLEKENPFLNLPPLVMDAVRYALREYCEQTLRTEPAVTRIEKVRRDESIHTAEYIAALVLERYEGMASNTLLRLVLVPKDEMDYVQEDMIEVEPGAEHQRFRARTHNAMVGDYKSNAVPLHCFPISIPVE